MKDKEYNWAYDVLRDLHFSRTTALYGNLVVNLIIIAVIAFIIDRIATKVLVFVMNIIAKRTKTSFDDFVVQNKTPQYIAHLIPVLYIYKVVPVALTSFTYWEYLFSKGITAFIILLSLWIIRSIFNSIKDYLKLQPDYNDKPIDSYVQVVMIMLWIFAITGIVLELFNTSVKVLLSTFGAISALVILIFKDTILGLVASIQVTINDIVRIGDWITIEKFGADGDVIEINLATVKVRNFDNTTTTVPTYSLISDSFKNWRGMLNSGGRRIKRHILIKANSVRFVHENELEELKKIQLIASYLDGRKLDIDKYNEQNNIDKSLSINGRNLTNLGIFRKYINSYIETHPGVNKDMTIMCRHLQPTEKGIPIEIYVFTSDKRWINHEYIMADIFDHIIASVAYFDLEIFELPTGKGYIDA
ncbi:mechanosensitive ion channel family protein [Flavobacterium subsaxonicum]|uniref:Mechanosensitive ion channel protein MscS n=1 Tax=Flavobacterium subsaxonicum WB 4.1-42 = DSM 21790 TaxID=1121898 RepID=A0A0A2MR53_9FLAO|nr:mechanosensitive ion channel domain-containing protein [Flavobacterium subsaxonicum]KGO94819.1 mechanosensitive ion channel protein MscS [Flavobacterium subsaxonicum WB 4.1-42 = DSM 21790]